MKESHLWPPLPQIERSRLSKKIKPTEAEISAAETVDIEDMVDSDTDSMIEIPPFLREAISDLVQAQQRVFDAPPRSGQIVKLRPITELIGDMPCHLLLQAPLAGGYYWSALMVSSEADYAGVWDMLLERHLDGPPRPDVQMIQVWNRVTLPVALIDEVVAALSPERLQQVEALMQQYQRRQIPQVAPQPGRMLSHRLPSGAIVLTGTPLRQRGDPRAAYQQIYRKLTAQLTAEIATLPPAPDPISRLAIALEQGWRRVVSELQQWQLAPNWRYATADAMAENSTVVVLQIGDLLHFSLALSSADDSLILALRLHDEMKHSLQVALEGGAYQMRTLTPQQPEATLILPLSALESDASWSFRLRQSTPMSEDIIVPLSHLF